jgi:hypothetical protein
MTGPNPDLWTTGGIAGLSVLGAIAKGAQWRDQTGKVSFGLLTSGIALSLVMATVIRAVGVHFGIEPWAQVAGAGVSCYVGPDPILKAIAGIALKRFGVSEDAKNGRGNP